MLRALGVQRWRSVGPPNMRSYRVARSTAEEEGEEEEGSRGAFPDDAARAWRFLTSYNFRCLCAALTTGDPAALGPVHGAPGLL